MRPRVHGEFSTLSREELVGVALDARRSLDEFQGRALALAQSLSIEFELLDYNALKPEFREEQSLLRQANGMKYTERA